MKKYIEVMTSKGIVKEKTGYFVIFDKKDNRYKIRHVLEKKSTTETWSEGIIVTEDEARLRAKKHNDFLYQRRKNNKPV